MYRSNRRDGGNTPFGFSTGAARANAFEGHGNPGHSSSLGENGEELPSWAAGGSRGVSPAAEVAVDAAVVDDAAVGVAAVEGGML